MRARDIMTRKVYSVPPTASVSDIVKTMVRRRVSAVPVVDRKRRVLGIVSEGDLLRRVEIGTERRRSWWYGLLIEPTTQAREFVKPNSARASDVMTKPVISIADTTAVEDIVDLMERWDVKRVPVLKSGRLAGLVSRRDVVQALAAGRRPSSRGTSDDATIRELLRRKLASVDWVDTAFVNFVVNRGVIELNGLVPSAEQRDAIRVMAERIGGVRKVTDRLQVRPVALSYA